MGAEDVVRDLGAGLRELALQLMIQGVLPAGLGELPLHGQSIPVDLDVIGLVRCASAEGDLEPLLEPGCFLRFLGFFLSKRWGIELLGTILYSYGLL